MEHHCKPQLRDKLWLVQTDMNSGLQISARKLEEVTELLQRHWEGVHSE